MSQILFPVLFAVALWWSSTLLVLFLNGLPRRTGRQVMGVASAIGVLALGLVALTADRVGGASAYLAFTAGLLIWGWHEVSYYTGMVTGPSQRPCPGSAGPLERFRRGVGSSLYHELAIVATAGLLCALTWRAPNQIATATFVVLWLMRWSSKLNIFLGVRNLHQEFWPEHLQYLASFARQRRMNLLFPFSVTAGTVAITLLVRYALSPLSAADQVAGLMLLATILALGVLEHWLLMLPLPDEVLWRWAMRGREQTAPGTAPIPAERPSRRAA